MATTEQVIQRAAVSENERNVLRTIVGRMPQLIASGAYYEWILQIQRHNPFLVSRAEGMVGRTLIGDLEAVMRGQDVDLPLRYVLADMTSLRSYGE